MVALWNRADHYIFILSFVMAAMRSRCGHYISERELMFTFAIAVARPSVCLSSVTFVRPTQAVQIFWQYFYGIRYLGHPLTSIENFTEIVPGEPLHRGS